MEPPPPPWNNPSYPRGRPHHSYQTHSRLCNYQAPPVAYSMGSDNMDVRRQACGSEFQCPYPPPPPPLPPSHQPPYDYQAPLNPSYQQWNDMDRCGPSHEERMGLGVVQGVEREKHEGRLLQQACVIEGQVEPWVQPGGREEYVSETDDGKPAYPSSLWVTDDSLPDSAVFGKPGGQRSSLSQPTGSTNSSRRGDFLTPQTGPQGNQHLGFGMRYHPPPARRTSQHNIGSNARQGVGFSAVELIAAEKFPQSSQTAEAIEQGSERLVQHTTPHVQSLEDPPTPSRVPVTWQGSHPASEPPLPRDYSSSGSTRSSLGDKRGRSRSVGDSVPGGTRTLSKELSSQAKLGPSKDRRKEGERRKEDDVEEQSTRARYQNSFMAKVQKFVARHAEAFDILVKESTTHPPPQPPPVPCDSRAEEACEICR